MINKKFNIIIIICLLSILGCKEEINLVSDQYDKSFVVDGMITNQPGPYTVKVSYTSAVHDGSFRGISGCDVTIEEKYGEKELLTEAEPGIYKTHPNGIQGKTGKSYRLVIETNEGKIYQSDYQEMPQPIEIDTVSARLEYEKRASLDPLPGYQFYISTKETTREGSYFLWKMEETFEYTSRYKIEGIMRDGEFIFNVDPDSLYKCWKTQRIRKIYTDNSVGISSKRLKNSPLHFINNQTKRLQRRYSLLIEQFSLNKNSYSYWSEVESQVTGENFLDSKQPYKLTGNIYNPEDEQEPVLGNFTVASKVKRRFFFESPGFYIKKTACWAETELDMFKGNSYKEDVLLVIGEQGLGAPETVCVDCRAAGGKLKPPEFWEPESDN
jgi:hypothetical protein